MTQTFLNVQFYTFEFQKLNMTLDAATKRQQGQQYVENGRKCNFLTRNSMENLALKFGHFSIVVSTT